MICNLTTFRIVILILLPCIYLIVFQVILDGKEHTEITKDTEIYNEHDNDTKPHPYKKWKYYKAKDAQDGIKRRFPAFIIIGAQKCGTQALATFLDLHSHLHRSRQFEVHFFDKRLPKNYSYDWYLDAMPSVPASHMGFEKTPAYLDMANPKDIYNMNKDVKLIVIICDPVDRAMSAYLHRREHGIFPNNSEFGDVAINKWGQVNKTCDVIERGLYVNYIKKYLKYFPLDQMLFLDKANYKQDPFAALRTVESFLNVPHFDFTKVLYFNSIQGVNCVVPTPKNLEKINKGKNRETIDSKGCFDETKHRQHPPMSLINRNKLQQFFKFYNTELSKLTGVNFTWISYDSE
ncbi:unnamed protein product [Owenia fusiformis]|uniref:Uncharacterized protein n=1 Tax=Owenia fusiformis TaxID=6347 RepID=A0A8J1Y783_OWEFU|nr:unnamed protein product [Owenia fusiformis]